MISKAQLFAFPFPAVLRERKGRNHGLLRPNEPLKEAESNNIDRFKTIVNVSTIVQSNQQTKII